MELDALAIDEESDFSSATEVGQGNRLVLDVLYASHVASVEQQLVRRFDGTSATARSLEMMASMEQLVVSLEKEYHVGTTGEGPTCDRERPTILALL